MNSNQRTEKLEFWAGIEGTVNRVGDTYFDQMARTGHRDRVSDLDLLADIGITAVRYPILWEYADQGEGHRYDWQWADERLPRLRELGIDPVAGLEHHGSGPPYTSLVDPRFPEMLAQYAGALARRFPWLKRWTPVNEPLTTARFSGLYGHWYPHGNDLQTFAQALVNQCKAVTLTMRAVREVNPEAELVQTEDMGKTHSTPLLRYQAAYENERRWLSLDLLSGKIWEGHPMWRELVAWGIAGRELEWFVENPCPPDIMGINHYLTSERYLDENLDAYPAHHWGGNNQHRYADVEAVRVEGIELSGFYGLLGEAWERYRIPLAITEAHLGCSREEQMRWLLGAWQAASRLRNEGVDMRAVTAWAAFGSHDWHCLVVRDEGHYEPGLFDCRSPEPRPTALARLGRQLARGERPRDPLLAQPGWWERDDRFFYGAEEREEDTA